MTIRHCMSGRSGLPDFFETGDDWDPDRLNRTLKIWVERNLFPAATMMLLATTVSNVLAHSVYREPMPARD